MIGVYQEWDIMKESKNAKNTENVNEKYHLVVPKKIGLQIHEARIKKRMTVFSLAEELNKDAHTIAMYENGSEIPDQNVLSRMEAILSINFNSATL